MTLPLPTDPVRTVVTPPVVAWPDGHEDPPTASVQVVEDPALPGSPAFRAQPTVVVSAAQARALATPEQDRALATPEQDRTTVVPAAPETPASLEGWSATAGQDHAADLRVDETLVLAAPLDDRTVVVTAETVSAPPLVEPGPGEATVVVPALTDPAGTVVVAVPFPPLAAALEAASPEPETADAPTPRPERVPEASTPDQAAAAWWASAGDRAAAMRVPESPVVYDAPAPPAPPVPPAVPAPASTIPAATPEAPVTAPPPVVPPSAAPGPPPVPGAHVAAAVAAGGAVPAAVSRPALGGSAMKLGVWVAALAVVGTLGVLAARRWAPSATLLTPAPTPAEPAPAAPAPTAPAQASCETERALKSSPGTGEARLQVTNKTAAPIVVHWLNLAGVREKWFEVSPGAMRSQRTPPTYRWVVARADGTCLAVISGQGSVVVE